MATEEIPPASQEAGGYGDGRYRTLVGVLVALAVGLRLFHFLRNEMVWCDEDWLLGNIFGKTFLQLLGPLSDIQAAPPLFLWLERLVWLAFGENIYAMRFFPLLAGVASLPVLVWLGRRLVQPAALPFAVLLLGCSDSILNYTCEVKPYIVDALLGLVVPTLFVATARWQSARRLALFRFLAPAVIFLSYPGCFIYGGLLVALLPGLWSDRNRWQAWLGYVLLVLVTFTAFVLLLAGPIRAQHTGDMHYVWADVFPDWHRPWTVPWWSAKVFLSLLEHLWRPTGGILVLPLVVGAVSLWRRNYRTELGLLLLPMLLGMLASWGGVFPFEGGAVLYTVGPTVLLIAEGIVVTGQWLRQWTSEGRPARYHHPLTPVLIVVLGVILLWPLSATAHYVMVPWSRIPALVPRTQAGILGR